METSVDAQKTNLWQRSHSFRVLAGDISALSVNRM